MYFKSGETIIEGFFKSKLVLTLVTLVLLTAAIAASLAGITHSRAAAAAGTPPSGERIHGQSVLEPAFDDTTAGDVEFVMTPLNTPLNANPRAWAPFYVPVYPAGVSFADSLQCAHMPKDNCPDHGPPIAALAASMFPKIYGPADGSGVAGHDHLMAPPGSGGNFNIAWEPIFVLFTNAATMNTVNTRLTTLDQIIAVVNSGQAKEIPLPQLTFHCEVVPEIVYTNSTPVTPV